MQPGDLCLTFDDNLLCQYKVALPVLRQFGLTAFWFVYTSVNQGNAERLEIYRHFRTVAFPGIDAFYTAFDAFLVNRPEADMVAEARGSFQPKAYLPDYVYLSDNDKIFRYVRDRVLGRERYEAAMDAMLAHYGFDMGQLLGVLWMGDAHLKELHGEGHVIGLHSHTHPTLLEALSVAEQREEYRSNASHLTALLGELPRAVSHPNNSYSPETLKILAEMGVTTGFRANMTDATNAALELPRHNHAVIHRSLSETRQ